MALILNIETSSPVCSVCLSEDGYVIAEHNELIENKHASGLICDINELMHMGKVKFKDLSAIAVSSGPGSYTGLRIGTSVAKGLCYGLSIPLIGVSTLQALANEMSAKYPDSNGVYIPMLDARRDDVYMAIYNGENNIIEKDNFVTVSVDLPDILSNYNVKNIYFGGTGSGKARLINLNDTFGTFIENLICIAKNISSISYKRFINGSYDDHLYFEPFYLKEFEGRMKIN
jgi:tRNA threonylcarbamoyladenosine biosynthesis protein TsaB